MSVALMVILSACQTQPITYYTPPADMQLGDSATLVGSKVLVRNILYGDEITYVLSIDGIPVEEGWKNHDIPIQLLPGKHDAQVGFVQSNGCAQAIFEVNVQSRKRYFARAEKLGRESMFRQERLRIWIEDSEGNQIADDAVVPFELCGSGIGGFIFAW